MLCRTTDHLPMPADLPGGAQYEPKYDGFRALAGVAADGAVQLRSRQGIDLTRAFPEIAAAAALQLPPGSLVDGELVIWDGSRLDFSQLQRRLASPARAARAVPASYLLFDVLQHAGHDLTGEFLRVRRRRLEAILATLSPPLQVTPATRDPDVAAQWFADYALAGVGVEGLVVKGLTSKYVGGRRIWWKMRVRGSVEAVVGAVTGTMISPQRLILGLPAADGSLIIAGTTTLLSPAQRLEVGPLLQSFTGTHPWPPEVATRRAASWGGHRRQPVTRVEPALVVELDADTSAHEGRFRHPLRLVRIRPDLRMADLSPLGGTD